ncbi:Fic family protein [Patescibacteria group bacterium]|nr:Fic family protein [Patescibacteria group bacterium]MCL5409393.1 Fic family protein [Patescibacteria group bacterium]
MFVPKFTISQKLLKNVGVIEASRELILNSPLIPAWEAKFRREALEKTVHHGTHLEGNQLTFEQAQGVLDGQEIIARDRDVQEVINYRNVMRFIDEIASRIGSGRKYYLTLETILEVHRLAVDRVLPEDHAGKFRDKQVVLKNSQTGQVSYTPPPAAEVPYLVEDLLSWINGEDSKDLHPVLKAGIIHYELSRIHPFTDGNGRAARAIATLVMFLEGYDIRKFFSLEEYFDNSPMDYYVTLQAVSNQLVMDNRERDLSPWLEYFVEGVAIQLNNTKERVKKISVDARVKDRLGEQVALNERQMVIMEYLNRNKAMQNKDFRKMFPDYSDDTVLRELKFLKQKGLIKKIGGTKKASYVLAG